MKAGQIQIEINTYANPYPYINKEISSFLAEYLVTIGRIDLIEQYNLKSFSINVLDKRRTTVEKLVSLFRFSFRLIPLNPYLRKFVISMICII